jgi:phosphatidylserine decarboxylase
MVSDAYRFFLPLLALALLSAALSWFIPAAVLALMATFTGYFFRNPKRLIPEGENLVVAPADGKIVRIAPSNEGEAEKDKLSISIFLNIFDVHVNRSPIAGELERVEYRRGKFMAAYEDEASRFNEQNILVIRAEGGRIVVKQIAGLIARRVVCWKQPGQTLRRGELFGLIRFGSRVDVLVPRNIKLQVKVGDRVKGGSSVLGELT